MDVCGAPALTARVVGEYAGVSTGSSRSGPVVAVVGGAGKSGSLSLAAAKAAGAARTIGVVPHQAEADLLTAAGIADVVVVADARDPVALSAAVTAAGGPADVTVVCVDVPGCEGGAILSTADRRHGRLLLDGHLVQRRRPRRRGARGRRDDAGRQRVRAGARRPRAVACCAGTPVSARCSSAAWASGEAGAGTMAP